jgi:hypothetical protein
VALLAVVGEIQVPLRDALQGGVSSGGEGAEQVERGGRLRVGPDHPLRVRGAALLVERVAVDVVAPVAGQLHAAPHLERLRPRLRELTGHPTNLRAPQSNHHFVQQEERVKFFDFFFKKIKTLTTGIWPPNMRTADIWRRTRKVSRMLLPWNSLKLSAQSPPWRRKARPTAASARRSSRRRASPENTIAGNASTVLSTASSSAAFGYSGSCRAFFAFQPSTAHFPGAGAFGAAAVTDFDGSAAWTARMVWRLSGRKEGERQVWPPEMAAALVASAIAERCKCWRRPGSGSGGGGV